MKHVGAHVSISGGVENAPLNAKEIGARAFAMFTKNQRQWKAPPLKESSIEEFKQRCRDHGFLPEHILPHDSYLINLGHPEPEKLAKSRDAFNDEMKRCEQLGLVYLNFHPGSTLGKITLDDCLKIIAESVNIALSSTLSVTAVVENTAGQGNTVGNSFEHLARIIELVDNKERIGVCLDTCHSFAGGYDFRTGESSEAVFDEFDQVVGLNYLKALHLNDSKNVLGKRVDRHEVVGKGTLGLEGFRYIMNDKRLDNIPMILETPDSENWKNEIAMLYRMVI